MSASLAPRTRALRLLAVFAGTLALLAGAGPSPASAAATSYRADVRSQSFDNDWRFALVNSADTTDPTGAYANAASPGYDDSAWRKLDVPHDWSIELPITNSPGAGTDAGSGYFPGGLGWYRKTFTLPASMTGKEISLEFDGVYEDSVIYVNGHQVANHPYGYTGFAVDLTPYVTTDGVTNNVVAVKVQNKLPGSRWYPGSGIERNVHLIVTAPVHVAREGTFVTTPDLQNTYTSGNYANVDVKTTVQNQSGAPQTVGVTNRIKDATGAVLSTSSSRCPWRPIRRPTTAPCGWIIRSSGRPIRPTSTRWRPTSSSAARSSTAQARGSACAGCASTRTTGSS